MISLKEIDITIVLATRGRTHDLARLLTSIQNKTTNHKRIEVLVGVDYDDPCLQDIHDISAAFPFDVIVVAQKRSQNISHDYINRLFGMARGYWLFVLNDDTEVVSSGWDHLLMQRVPKRVSDPVYLDTKDNTRNFNNNGEFACFPIINRPCFDAMVCFFFPMIPTWGADKWLHGVCAEAGIIQPAFEIEIYHYMNKDDDSHRHMKSGIEKHGCCDGWSFGDTVERLKKALA